MAKKYRYNKGMYKNIILSLLLALFLSGCALQKSPICSNSYYDTTYNDYGWVTLTEESYKKLYQPITSKTDAPDLNTLKGLYCLESLDLYGGTTEKSEKYNKFAITDYSALGELKNLKQLNITQAYFLKDLSFLRNLTKLQKLIIKGSDYISDISVLANLTQLQVLDISAYRDGIQVVDISSLSKLQQLRELKLYAFKNIKDYSFIQDLWHLTRLNLQGCNIQDLSVLEKLDNIKFLNLYITPVKDISPLKNLDNLEELRLGYTSVTDFLPLKDLHRLRLLWTITTVRVSKNPTTNLSELKKYLPCLIIRAGYSGGKPFYDYIPVDDYYNPMR